MSIVKPIIGLDLDEVAEGSDAVDEIVLGAVCVQSRSVLQRAKRNALHRGRLSQLFGGTREEVALRCRSECVGGQGDFGFLQESVLCEWSTLSRRLRTRSL